MPVAQQTYTWRDAKGNTVTTKFFVSGATVDAQATAAENIRPTIAAITNAALQAGHGPNAVPPQEVVYGVNAPYPTVEDKVIFTFQTASGSIHRFQIPAPISAIFLADGETVDPANALVVAFTSAIVANATAADGQAIAFGAFGTRIRRKMHRKLNIFVKNPALTGPGE